MLLIIYLQVNKKCLILYMYDETLILWKMEIQSGYQ